jgi:hypothetical protein
MFPLLCVLVLAAPFGYDATAPSAVDPRLVVAIAGAESTFGKNLCTANNAWNWFHRRTCPPSAFQNFGEGIERVTKFLRRSYLNKGYTTIPLIQTKYCGSGCQNWTPLVTRFHSEMPSAAPAAQAPQKSGPQPPALRRDSPCGRCFSRGRRWLAG